MSQDPWPIGKALLVAFIASAVLWGVIIYAFLTLFH